MSTLKSKGTAIRRSGRALFARALMGVWIVVPLFPVLGALCSWWVGVR